MEKNLKIERMRYQENKISYNLALLAFLLNQYYLIVTLNRLAINYHVGIEISINLAMFMFLFLGMEKVKKHDVNWSIGFMVMSLIYILRIFYMPKKLLAQGAALIATGDVVSIATGEAIQMAGYKSGASLIVIGILLFVSGMISYKRSTALRTYNDRSGRR